MMMDGMVRAINDADAIAVIGHPSFADALQQVEIEILHGRNLH